MIAIPARFTAYSKPKKIKELKRVLSLFLKGNRPTKEKNKRGPTSDKDNIAKRF